MSTQVSQQPTLTNTSSFQAPDNSFAGQVRKVPDDFDEEHVTKRQKIDDEITVVQDQLSHGFKSPASISWQKEVGLQASDHQLAASASDSASEIRAQKVADETSQPALVEMSLEQLQKNVGEVFHLCKSGKTPLFLWH